MLVSVSFLKNNNGLKKTIQDIDKSNANYIHVDIMDNIFAQGKVFTFEEIKNSLNNVNKELDVHLMVEDPIKYIKDYETLKPKYITFHIEIKQDINSIINYLKSKNIKVGIAINPETRIFNIMPYLKDIDLVLVMGVNPGKGGQKFINDVTKKIDELKALQKKYNYIISVDGGVNNETIKLINSDMVVSGSYVVSSNNYNEKIETLKK